MALVLADRVQETSTTTGTGTLTLDGASASYQTFSAGIGNGNTCYYTIQSDTGAWEVGVGTVGAGTLARTTLISSSTGGAISFSGTLTVFVTYPAEKAVYGEGTNLIAPNGALLPITSGGTGASTAAGARTALGLGTIATQAANSVAITGGAIDGTTVGATTVAAGSFSTLNSSGATRLGGLSGNQSLQVNNVASAVNYAQIVGATTTGTPTYSAQGTDTNIGLSFLAKGTGGIFVGGTSISNPSLLVSTVTSQVNSFQVFGQVTGQPPTLAAIGSDTNIGIAVQAKGTGAFVVFGNSQQSFNISTASGSDFTNYYNTTGNLNYTAAGGSTNINFYYQTKGTGGYNFTTGGGQQVGITSTASAVNYVNLTGAATTAAPTLSAQGSDSNINLTFTPKGTGVVTTTSITLSNTLTTAAYTETIVASGTVGASATLAITAGTVLTATLTSATACTFTMPTATAGKSFTLLLKQPAAGSATTATFTGVKWNSGGAPTITATLGRLDILAFVADGTNWYGTASQGYTY